jgi:alpha-tubulin suppressor-like RCC1 family protein
MPPKSEQTDRASGLVTSSSDLRITPLGHFRTAGLITVLALLTLVLIGVNGSLSSAGGTNKKAESVRVVSISSGGWFTCALLSNGRVMCWGYNHSGELGNGTRRKSLTPVTVKGIKNATMISAGGNLWNGLVCARLRTGEIKCWGTVNLDYISPGEIRGSSKVPIRMKGVTRATEVSVGWNHVCARISGGTVRCWGDGGDGELGDGRWQKSFLSPVRVIRIRNAISVSAGGTYKIEDSCAVLSTRKMMCWGGGALGLVGGQERAVPHKVRGIRNVKGVAVAWESDCVVFSSGKVKCWGDNEDGQVSGKDLGTTATTVRGISTATQLSSTWYHTCAVLGDGTIECWGDNGAGQLGDGVTDHGHGIDAEERDFSPTPVTVSGVANAAAVSAGYEHTCALLSDGTVECWGSNKFGQLGNGTSQDSPTPVVVTGLP